MRPSSEPKSAWGRVAGYLEPVKLLSVTILALSAAYAKSEVVSSQRDARIERTIERVQKLETLAERQAQSNELAAERLTRALTILEMLNRRPQ